MSAALKRYFPGLVGLAVLLGLTMGVAIVLVDPIGRDILLLALYLLASGSVTVVLAFASVRFGLPRRIGTIQSRLVLVCMLVTLLSLSSIGFVALLMFLSTHDLGLLAGLLIFSLGLSVFFAVTLSEAVTGNIRDLTRGGSTTRIWRFSCPGTR